MFKKLLMKYATKEAKKDQAKQMKQQLTEKDRKNQEIYKQLRQLYQFVRWLDKYGFRNRRERKNFWRAVQSNTHVMQDTILSVSDNYTKKDEKVYKAPPEEKKAGIEVKK